MKVKQLKALLKEFDDEMEVVVQEYNGCDDVMRSVTDVQAIQLRHAISYLVHPDVMKRRSGQMILKISGLIS